MYRIEQNASQCHANSMESGTAKLPIERRRAGWREADAIFSRHEQIWENRRETDLARVRLQRWIKLADVALSDEPVEGLTPKRHRKTSAGH